MSAINNTHDALDFLRVRAGEEGLASRFGRTVKAYWTTLGAGLAAARAYHELTARGVPHDEAVRKVFDEHLDGH